MRKQRAKLKQELAAGKAQILLPTQIQTEQGMIDNDETSLKLLNDDQVKYTESKKETEVKSALNSMEQFVSDNFVQQTISNHVENMKKRRKVKSNQAIGTSLKSEKFDPFMDGAVPSHFMDQV